ncbi:Uncharacterized protein QTN25_002658 [Entamoeba marina]
MSTTSMQIFEQLASVADWDTIKNKIDSQKVPLSLLLEVLYLIGEDVSQAYGYSIMKLIFKGKDLKEVAEFIYNNLCDQDIFLVAEYLGGIQNIPEVERNIEGKPVEDSAIYVFGNDAEGAKNLGLVFKYLQHQYSLGWEDLISVVSSAMKNWGLLSPGDKFLQLFLCTIAKELTVDEVIILISKIIESCDEDEEKQEWTMYNKKITQLLQMLTNGWNSVDKKQFIRNGPLTWSWSSDSIKKLNKLFK